MAGRIRDFSPLQAGNQRKYWSWGVLIAIALFLAGCGSDNKTASPSPTAIQGNVSKGPLAGSTVNVYQINADGSRGGHAGGPWVTDANGSWTGQVASGVSGPFVVVVSGGSYIDEATGNSVGLAAGQELYGIMQTTVAVVTPLTHATFLGMQALVDGGLTVNEAILQAFANAQAAFGYSIATTVPSDAGAATADAKNYAGLLGGLSTLLDANPSLSAFANTPPIELVIALAKDMANGQLDGLDALGNVILIPTDSTGTTSLPCPALSAAGLSAWLNAATSYASTVPGLIGLSYNPGLTWKPSAPAAAASGNITFSGVGSSVLPSTHFSPTSFQTPTGQYTWVDLPNNVSISTVLVTGSSTLIQTVYVSYANGTRLWTAHGASGIAGVSRSGGTTTFSSVATQEISGAMTLLYLEGTLTEPTGP